IFAEGFTRYVSRQSMKIDSESGGFERLLRMLRNQAGDHSGEDVSRASGGHAGIAGGIHPDGAIGRGDQGAMSLEHDDQLMLAGEVTRNIQTVRLNLGNTPAGHAHHFTRVRRDHDGSSAAVELVGCSFES